MQENSRKNAVLSIDIGVKNLGYSILVYDDIIDISNHLTSNEQECNNIELIFDIFNISEHKTGTKDIVASRCVSLQEFFQNLISKYNIQYIIIEKQVNTNQVAMELMYAIYMLSISILPYTNVCIFDPKMKFTSINEIYETKNKHHKKQSIQYARSFLNNKFKNLVQAFESHKKQDDISDSLNQMLVYLSMSNIINISLTDLRKLYNL